MRKRRLIILALIAALTVLVLVAALSAAWAGRSARQIAGRQLQELTSEVLRSSQATTAQRKAVFARISQDEPSELCSAAHIRRMRTAAADADYLQGIGVVDGNTLRCTTLADLDAPVNLGAPVRHSPDGMRSWSAMRLPPIPDARFNINALGHYASLTMPGLVVDVLPEDSPLSVAHVGVAGPRPVLIRSRGDCDADWLDG